MFVQKFLIALGVGVSFAVISIIAITTVTEFPVTPSTDPGFILSRWRGALYSPEIPGSIFIWISVGSALFIAGNVAIIERRASNRARRSLSPSEYPLSPRVLMTKTRGVFLGEVSVTVVIPAHNEEATIKATLESLLRQTRPPDRIVLVADNCSDRTVDLAKSQPVEVFETVGNTQKKGGALNQFLKILLRELGHNDVVMIVDADTTLATRFIETGVARFTADRGISAIGGIFKGDPGNGLIGQLQRNEYDRYERRINRRNGQVFVLTGTATMFRAISLHEVAQRRGTMLGGTFGEVYDTVSLTEDNELTLALKTLGALMESPKDCVVHTELMPTWRMLWHQRMRWQRGALENIGSYGLTPATYRYWGQQLGIAYGVIALNLFFITLTIQALAADEWIWYPFWLAIGLIFIVERVFTVWHSGWRAKILAAMIVPELLYDMFIQYVFAKGMWDIAFGRNATWSHVKYGKHIAPDMPKHEPKHVATHQIASQPEHEPKHAHKAEKHNEPKHEPKHAAGHGDKS